MVAGKPTQRRAWPRVRRPAAAPGPGAGAARASRRASCHPRGRGGSSPHTSLGARPSPGLSKNIISHFFLKAFFPPPTLRVVQA